MKVFRIPPEQAAAMTKAMEEGWELSTDPEDIRARYKDWDRAERVPRVLMYYDIGVLMARIQSLEEALLRMTVPTHHSGN